MKNAFNISVPDDQEYPGLVIYMNEETLVFLDYAKEPFRAGGIHIYQFAQHATTADWVHGIRQAIQDHDSLLERYANAHIYLDFHDTILSPAALPDEFAPRLMMDSVFGEKKDQRLMQESEHEGSITIHYQAPVEVVELLEKYFPGSSITHANGCLLSASEEGAVLQVIVFAHSIKTILHTGGNLQFIGSMEYQTSTDAVYHLLNLCRNYESDPSVLKLRLNGMIDSQSILYEDIYRYFLNVTFDNADQTHLSSSLTEYPAHFFNYFIRLAQCAS